MFSMEVFPSESFIIIKSSYSSNLSIIIKSSTIVGFPSISFSSNPSLPAGFVFLLRDKKEGNCALKKLLNLPPISKFLFK